MGLANRASRERRATHVGHSLQLYLRYGTYRYRYYYMYS
jgi:hypothetical protein